MDLYLPYICAICRLQSTHNANMYSVNTCLNLLVRAVKVNLSVATLNLNIHIYV